MYGWMSVWDGEYIVGVVVKGEGARVQPEYHPGVEGVEVDGLHPRRTLQHFLFDFESQRHT